MKKLLLSILAILLCASFADAQIISIAKKKAAGGGPDTYYYSEGLGEGDFSANIELESGYMYAANVTVTTGGSLTKIGVKISDKSSANIKIMLLKNSAADVHECAEIANATLPSSGWYDYTLSTPLTVSNSEVVRVAIATSASYTIRINYDGSDNGFTDTTHAYATACGSAPDGWGGYGKELGVRVYVD